MRRAVMLLLLTALGIGLGSCDWPMFRYNTAHTGYNNTESAIGVSNVGTLVQKWISIPAWSVPQASLRLPPLSRMELSTSMMRTTASSTP